ncbi:MAG: hypothetical protein KKA42_00365 [candidate division Zixibacteria bacterium]|nr:hypothetical protein [candidate division Zixibacteria bacterium]
MLRICACVLITLLIGSTVSAQKAADDVLRRVLDEVGFDRSDLGYQPRGYWNRFPVDVPYRLPSFDDLFAEPLKLYDFSTVMGNAVELYLAPGAADTADIGLYKLLYHLGIDKRQSGFRDYSANLAEAPDTDRPLTEAFRRLYELADRDTEYRTFGNRYGTLNIESEIGEQLAQLPDTVQVVLARLLVNLADAIRWRNLAFRNCDRNDMEEAFAIRDLAQTQGDGQVYYLVLDDIATEIDQPSLHYAAAKTVAAVEQAERALIPLTAMIPDGFAFETTTPFGRIVLRNEKSDARVPFDCTNTLCIIEFGHDNVWAGTPGATASVSNPVSVLIDLGGDDVYGQEGSLAPPAAGVGLLGIGVVLDTKGKDTYNGAIYAQGAGLFGVGIVLDRSGNDTYTASESAQGCGYFGIGLCLDSDGDDVYYLHGDGQGMGGIGGGVGVLASFGGNDSYTAEPMSEVFNRGDYHSDNKINANNAQGAGMGRRGDGSDGHAWAGGLGALIDIHGDDFYYSGNFTLGVGYWFGTGIVLDKHGADHYKSCYFTQGSGAHFCNGILIDENGDDYHELYETAGAGLAFGWDFTNALLINKHGNDRYTAKMISYGLAEIRSNAFFVDLYGDDEYRFQTNARGMGGATWRADFAKPSKLTPYYTYAKSLGTFIDAGGNDRYISFDDSTETAHPLATNNSLWLQPARTDSTFGANNYGVGLDVAAGTIPEFFRWDSHK